MIFVATTGTVLSHSASRTLIDTDLYLLSAFASYARLDYNNRVQCQVEILADALLVAGNLAYSV
jgi:hypothetical protein